MAIRMLPMAIPLDRETLGCPMCDQTFKRGRMVERKDFESGRYAGDVAYEAHVQRDHEETITDV